MSWESENPYEDGDSYENPYEDDLVAWVRQKEKIQKFIRGELPVESLKIKVDVVFGLELELDFGNAIADNTVLTDLDLEGAFAHESNEYLESIVPALGEAIEKNTVLESLNLSRNYLSFDFIDSISRIFRNTSLTKLNLEANCFEDMGANEIALAMERNSTITSLSMNGGSNGIAQMLRKNSSLTELYLYQERIGYRELINNSELMELHLKNKDAYLQSIADALTINTTLTKLNLRGNGITENGCSILAELLDNNSTLMDLDVMYNDFDKCPHIFEGIIRKNTTLTSLNLRGCFEEEGFAIVTEALATNTTLTDINLSQNQVRENFRSIITILNNNNSLAKLSLAENELIDEDCCEIAKILSTNTTLTELDLSENDLGDHSARAFIDVLEHNTVLTSLDLSENCLGGYCGDLFLKLLSKNSSLTKLNLDKCFMRDNLIKKIDAILSEREVKPVISGVKAVVSPI